MNGEDWNDEIMARDCKCKSDEEIKDYCCRLNENYGEECCCSSVSNPHHYTVGGIETIDVIRAKLTTEEFIGHCKANVIKYITRASHKGKHDEDCKKAAIYASWLAQAVGAMPSLPEGKAAGRCGNNAAEEERGS